MQADAGDAQGFPHGRENRVELRFILRFSGQHPGCALIDVLITQREQFLHGVQAILEMKRMQTGVEISDAVEQLRQLQPDFRTVRRYTNCAAQFPKYHHSIFTLVRQEFEEPVLVRMH